MAEGVPNGLRPPQHPSFIAFICRPLAQRLKIPTAFMRKHGERLGEDVLLIDRFGGTWEARLSRTSRASWLCRMSDFGEHYAAQAGDVMMFDLVGYSMLVVTIFYRDGMEVVAAGRRD